MAEVDPRKLAAAESASALVEDGMIVGLGSGSTAALVVAAIGRRVARGLRIVGIPTSEDTEHLARGLGIPLSTLDEHGHIDLTLDGADEVEPVTRDVIKGRGGALLREKIVARVSRRLAIVVDDSKLVAWLCPGREPIPVEVVPFGWKTTAARLENVGAEWTLRTTATKEPFVTDGGHYILDCSFPPFNSAVDLQHRLDELVGVVEHGLFLGMATEVIVGQQDGGVRRI